MNVILLEKVANLGLLGDKVAVKSGYARNFLVPQGKAVFATEENVAAFEQKRAELEKVEKQRLEAAQARAEQLSALHIEHAVKAGEEGKLYGSLGAADLAEIISKQGVEVQKRELRMPAGPIRHLGEHQVGIQLHGDVVAEITVSVIAQ